MKTVAQEDDGPPRTPEVFISYSREDEEFVRRLDEAPNFHQQYDEGSVQRVTAMVQRLASFNFELQFAETAEHCKAIADAFLPRYLN